MFTAAPWMIAGPYRCVKHALPAALAIAACALGVDPAAAWGPVGHRAVGAIADELLDPAARAAVAQLLADDRDRNGQPSGRGTLAEVADWPDEIRGTPGDHPRWHYDNRPVCAPAQAGYGAGADGAGPDGAGPDGTPGADARTPPAWCARGECASAQLPALLAVLRDRRRARAERNEALKWVVHLVADLHQPLHAADLAGGGNRIRVARSGREAGRAGRHEGESLHGFWDSRLVALALHPRDGVIPAPGLQRLLQRAQNEDPARVAEAPEQWAQESNEIARSFALDLDGIGCESTPGARSEPTVTLSRAYVARAKQVVEERLALAGARLAHVLDVTLGAGRDK